TVFYRDDVGTQTIANIVIFNGDSLALRHNRFKFSEIQNNVGTIEASHGAADNFAGAVLKLLVNHLLFGLPNPLHHRLLGGLCGDASEIFWRDFDFDSLPDLRVGFDLTRL